MKEVNNMSLNEKTGIDVLDLREDNRKLREENKDLRARVCELAKENSRICEEKEGLTKFVQSLIKGCPNIDKKVKNIDSFTLLDFIGRQDRIFQNKVNHGFNVTNIYQEARYILEETAELMRAIEKNDRENMIEELADIVIFAYGCTEVARLGSLDKKIFEKMKINESREYKKTSEGDFVKADCNENNGGH